MPKIDLSSIPSTNASGYPSPYADAVQERWVRRLAPAPGLSDFGASHVTLKPGAWSAQRPGKQQLVHTEEGRSGEHF